MEVVGVGLFFLLLRGRLTMLDSENTGVGRDVIKFKTAHELLCRETPGKITVKIISNE